MNKPSAISRHPSALGIEHMSRRTLCFPVAPAPGPGDDVCVPELPDIEAYLAALSCRVMGRRLERLSIRGPFLVRTVDPPIDAIEGLHVATLRRLGKRLVLGFEPDLFLVIHLMIVGRLHWTDPMASDGGAGPDRRPGTVRGAKSDLARWMFDSGVLTLTEAGTTHRASLHLVRGEPSLAALDPGGIEPLACSRDDFAAALRRESRTIKRALTDPHTFSGIGNAYSDEILHHARLSPLTLTRTLSDTDVDRLRQAVVHVLTTWTSRLIAEAADRFPERVTAFRPEFAVHGKFGQPCPTCGEAVQRIVRAENEINYCPGCQTDGRILKDRSLSRLLRDAWPRTTDDLD
ncbi:MAG: hypothetical protein KJZ68_15995 [Phycisphaerales bacterium]|nr:hypothetical protein [Phycisphaerales bacterium]